MMFEIPALMATYAVADRFGGGGNPKLDAALPGRAMFWGMLLAMAISLALAGPGLAVLWSHLAHFDIPGAGAAIWNSGAGPLIAMALGWLAWRAPKFKLFKGASATPRTKGQIIATFFRHAIILIPTVLVVVGFKLDPVLPLITMTAFAVISTILAAYYGRALGKAIEEGRGIGNENIVVELARGVAFGGLLAVGF